MSFWSRDDKASTWNAPAAVLSLLILASPMAQAQTLRFEDVARKAGVDVTFHTGSRGKHDLPEIMGGGVALLDVDGDGWLDLYFPNGGPIAGDAVTGDPPSRLFRNLGNGRFQEITATANAQGPSYAMGCAVGDYDQDGRPDLFVTGWREQKLYRNLGDGRFADMTGPARLVSPFWSTSAAFGDLDGDGDEDLYVANYLRYDPLKAPYCAAPDGRRDFCGPEEFEPEPDRLYRNNGDGTFADVTQAAGILDPDGRGLGVLVADLVGDSRLDIYVANDGTPCRLYENRGGLSFSEVGTAAGVALDGEGRSLAGMGVAAGDSDGDGRIDLAVTNFLGRSTLLFQNRGRGVFTEESRSTGFAARTRSVLGFGVALEDFDGDGDLDLLQANGHVLDRQRLGHDFAMRPTLLRNDRGQFTEASRDAGAFFNRRMIARGLAVGDLDRDGRPDAVIVPLDGPVAVLKNTSTGGHPTRLNLISTRSTVGAVVKANVGGRVRVLPVTGGGSYLSASEQKLRVGLGEARLEGVEVLWPSGRRESFSASGRPAEVRIEEGRGIDLGGSGQSAR